MASADGSKKNLRKKAKKIFLENKIETEALSKQDRLELLEELGIHQIELEIQNEELKNSQKELEISRNRYKDLFDFAPLIYFIIDQNDVIVDVNLMTTQILGFNKQELLKKTFCSLLSREDSDIFYFFKNKIIKNQDHQEAEINIFTKNKIPIPFHITGIKIFPHNNLFQIAALDISKIKEKELSIQQNKSEIELLNLKLNENLAELNNIYYYAPVGLALLDVGFKYLRVNKIFADFFGLHTKDFIEKKINEVVPELANLQKALGLSVLKTGKPVLNVELKHKSANRSNRVIYLKENWFPLSNSLGKVTSIIVSAEDITEIKKAEKIKLSLQLNEIQKMEREKIGSEIHDTVLQSIYASQLFTECMEKNWEKDPKEAVKNLKIINSLNKKSHAELQKILSDLLPRKISGERIEYLFKELANSIKSNSKIKIDLKIKGEYKLPEKIKHEVYRISQEALNNIIKHSKATIINIELGLFSNRISLIISDNGVGIDVKKRPLKTGFGTNIMKQRAKIINASLDIKSIPGEGTTLTLVKKFK